MGKFFIISIFILLSVALIMPYLNEAFGTSSDDYNISDATTSPTYLGFFDIFTAIAFWDFSGTLPLLLNIFLWIPRTIVYISLYMLVRMGDTL